MVSIIIPTYNRSHIIGETLDSIKQQTFTDWECIIVDDGSTDDTQSLIAGYSSTDSRFKFYSRPQHLVKGANSCRNFGFEVSKGQYILWLDSDDLLVPEALHTWTSCFDHDSDAVVAKVCFTDLKTGREIRLSHNFSDELVSDYLIGNIAFYISGPLWKRHFLKDKTLFDPSLSNLDDWDFNLRRIYESPKLVFLKDALVLYRIHPESLSHEIDKSNPQEIRSEFRARYRHLRILKNQSPKNYAVLLSFTFERYRYLLRNMLINNRQTKYMLFRNYMAMLAKHGEFFRLSKTAVAFTSMLFFKKGYKLFS